MDSRSQACLYPVPHLSAGFYLTLTALGRDCISVSLCSTLMEQTAFQPQIGTLSTTEIQVITSVHGSLTKTSTQAPKRQLNWERAAVNLHLCFPPALTAISSPSIKPNASPNIDSKSDFEVLPFFSALSDGSGKREETARPKYAPNRWTCIMHTWYETCISRVSKFVTNHVPQETLTQMLM